jgi:hypothetical protein
LRREDSLEADLFLRDFGYDAELLERDKGDENLLIKFTRPVSGKNDFVA